MKITKATIENYRSIEKLEIDLEAEGNCQCRILAGINESGKSNTLKALALLAKDSQVSYAKDINKKAKGDKRDIRVLYQLENSAVKVLKERMEVDEVPAEIIEHLAIEKITRVVSFDSTSARKDYFFVYLTEMPTLSGYSYSALKRRFVKEEIEPIASVSTPAPQQVVSSPTTTSTLVAPISRAAAPEELIVLDDKAAWENVIEDFYAGSVLEALMPRVIFWAYKEEYLINREINLTAFSADPAGTSKPLHNVFNLAGYTDAQIPVVIADALADGATMGELADKLSQKVTEYLEEVWPEHRVSIKVHTADPTIAFHVVEKDSTSNGRYEVAERSDGFKHFFAILLNLAAENTTSHLKDCLILLDEPEVHLHPSGAKFLRDELLKIARNNVVVYSTHSIFMIDRTCLNRHYKVYKDNETTTLLKIDGSNPFKEELIYEAIGTSILDLISEHNLLVEGLTDKKLLDVFTQKFRADLQPLDINIMNVDGEQRFDQYCKFFNKKSIKGYILTDSDKDGVAAKARILRDNAPGYNAKNTFEINDVVSTGKNSTLEDLLPKEVLQKCTEDFCAVSIVFDDGKTFVEKLSHYNRVNDKSIDTQKLKMFICDFVCDDITKRTMTKEKTKEKYSLYYQFVDNLHTKLKEASIT